GIAELFRRAQVVAGRLERRIGAALELGDPVLFDVEPDRRKVLTELDGQRQTDVAEPDDADAGIAQRTQIEFLPKRPRACAVGSSQQQSHATSVPEPALEAVTGAAA